MFSSLEEGWCVGRRGQPEDFALDASEKDPLASQNVSAYYNESRRLCASLMACATCPGATPPCAERLSRQDCSDKA